MYAVGYGEKKTTTKIVCQKSGSAGQISFLRSVTGQIIVIHVRLPSTVTGIVIIEQWTNENYLESALILNTQPFAVGVRTRDGCLKKVT